MDHDRKYNWDVKTYVFASFVYNAGPNNPRVLVTGTQGDRYPYFKKDKDGMVDGNQYYQLLLLQNSFGSAMQNAEKYLTNLTLQEAMRAAVIIWWKNLPDWVTEFHWIPVTIDAEGRQVLPAVNTVSWRTDIDRVPYNFTLPAGPPLSSGWRPTNWRSSNWTSPMVCFRDFVSHPNDVVPGFPEIRIELQMEIDLKRRWSRHWDTFQRANVMTPNLNTTQRPFFSPSIMRTIQGYYTPPQEARRNIRNREGRERARRLGSNRRRL